MKLLVSAVSALALLSAAVAASAGPAAAQDQAVHIAFFGFSADNAYTMAAYQGLQQAAKDAGNVDVQFFDGAFDAQKQYNQVEDATTTGRFNAKLIMANDYSSIVPAARDAISAGAKFGALEYPLGPDATITDKFQVPGLSRFVGYNVSEIGTAVAKATVDACAGRNPCKVALMVGSRSAAQEIPKIAAYNAYMKDHPEVQTVAVMDMGWARDQGLKDAQDLMQSHPDVNVISCLADQALAGVEVALEGAGITPGDDTIKLIGLGATKTALAAIRDGRRYGTYVELPYDKGYIGGKNIIAAVRGQKFSPSVDLEKLSPVGAPVATKALVDAKPDWQAKWDG